MCGILLLFLFMYGTTFIDLDTFPKVFKEVVLFIYFNDIFCMSFIMKSLTFYIVWSVGFG